MTQALVSVMNKVTVSGKDVKSSPMKLLFRVGLEINVNSYANFILQIVKVCGRSSDANKGLLQ